MIGGHREQYRIITVRYGLQGCERERGGRIPPLRLKQDGGPGNTHLGKLLRGYEPVRSLTHDDWITKGGHALKPACSQHGLLEHGVARAEGQELLGVVRPRQRPETRPGAPA
jgi:hypothetical protein